MWCHYILFPFYLISQTFQRIIMHFPNICLKWLHIIKCQLLKIRMLWWWQVSAHLGLAHHGLHRQDRGRPLEVHPLLQHVLLRQPPAAGAHPLLHSQPHLQDSDVNETSRKLYQYLGDAPSRPSSFWKPTSVLKLKNLLRHCTKNGCFNSPFTHAFLHSVFIDS